MEAGQGRPAGRALTIGLLLTVLITAASVQDRDGAKPLLWNLRKAFPSSGGPALPPVPPPIPANASGQRQVAEVLRAAPVEGFPVSVIAERTAMTKENVYEKLKKLASLGWTDEVPDTRQALAANCSGSAIVLGGFRSSGPTASFPARTSRSSASAWADGQAGGAVTQLGDNTRQLVSGHARRAVAAGAVGPRAWPVQPPWGEPGRVDAHDHVVFGRVG
jgi:hypothetical protein